MQIVKAFFPHREQPGRGEHMWLDDVAVGAGEVRGSLSGEPTFLPGLRQGQQVIVPVELVSDWVLFFGARQRLVNPPAKGGFTLGVLWRRMSEEDRANLSGEAPFCWFIDSGTNFGSV